MTRMKRRPGPRNTLVDVDDEITAEAKKLIAAKGHTTFSEGARAVGFHPNVLTRLIREGLSSDPKQRTVDRLKELGIYDVLRRRNSA